MKKHLPRKRFGQNFLRDPSVLQNILLAIAPKETEHVVEIGPGEGVLTDLLLPNCQRLDIIEIDRDLVAHLEKHYENKNTLKIHSGDALKFNFATLSKQPHSLRVVGNLPYNISTPILFKLFSDIDLIKDMHFMLQKEVVERLTAPVGDKHYGRLSVMAQYFCDCEYLFTIGPNAFYPPPKVDSALIRMIPIQRSLTAKSTQALSDIVKKAFLHRRKTVSNCLKGLISADELREIDINPSLRPQQLTVDNFVTISNKLNDH